MVLRVLVSEFVDLMAEVTAEEEVPAIHIAVSPAPANLDQHIFIFWDIESAGIPARFDLLRIT